MPRVCISGVGATLPTGRVTSREVEERIDIARFGLEPGWIERVTGINERPWADASVKPSDLAEQAATAALRDAGVEPLDIDTLIFCGITRNFIEPATANVVAESIGATTARVFDVTNACNGLIDGLDVAASLIESGRSSRVLVATGERASISVNWTPNTIEEFMLSVAGMVVGDAGGALVLEKTPDPSVGIVAREYRSDPTHWRLAIGGLFRPTSEACVECGSVVHLPFLCDGKSVLRVGMEMMLPAIDAVLKKTHWDYTDLEVVFCHEASKRFVETGMTEVGDSKINLGPRFWSTVGRLGNTSSVSLPIQISEAKAAGHLQHGTKSLLLAGGAGFSVAAVTVQW